MSRPAAVYLSENEINYIRALLRQAIRKSEKMQAHLRNKFGSYYDPTRADQSAEFRDRLQIKLDIAVKSISVDGEAA